MNFDEQYKTLNKAQKKAVDTIDGPLLVIAGPGSGKTQILSMRVGKILQETQIRASNILCLTFTESASVNMRKRLSSLIGQEAYRVAIHTFHNFCVEIIQKYPEYFYSGAFFSPADELTQIQILQNIFEKLPHKNLLSSVHPEQGFVYLKDSLYLIGNLKKAGIEPDEFKKILNHNKKLILEINEIIRGVFEDKISKEVTTKAYIGLEKLKKLSDKSTKDFPKLLFRNLAETTHETLKKATEKADEFGKTSPLTAWKGDFLKKDDENNNVLKDTVYIEKLLAFAEIYTEHRKLMLEKGYYDFDDMILDCKSTLEKNPSLRYEIQEQYQYILVDEFQDTNGAQMELLQLITDAPVNEGKPNIMAVGDDDQAVYKFQGAELSNILNFQKIFNDVKVITMTENYRSTQDILDIAREMIIKGEERLENLFPEIEKNLVASNPKIKEGKIKHKEFTTSAHEYHFIAKEIKKRIEDGENPEEIAVIARKHFQLEEIVAYLKKERIDIRYEREQNVFKEPHIAQIITLSKFLTSITNKHKDEADEYLPEILSFPFWNLKREDVWKISLSARRGENEKNWIEVMFESENLKIKDIASFLIELGVRSENEPLEKILDSIVGSHIPLSEESEDADLENLLQIDGNFISPFKQFYFSKEKFEHSKAEYLSFLSSLRVFVNALREYKSGEVLSIKDLVEFVELHEKNEIPLNDQSPFSRLKGAVNLMTAHGAKGLEFETVFVLSCQDDIWAGRGMGSKLVFPSNLPIGPSGDTEDDKLRLFYVAITRAKRYLYLTSYQTKENGKEAKKLRFLVSEKDIESHKKQALKTLYIPEQASKDEDDPEPHEVLTASWLDYRTTPFIGSEKKILETLVEEYKMSVTHLNNFLNIEKGGPQYFLEQNLLRFPQSKTASGSYGTAIHKTLEKFILSFKKEGKLPIIKETLDWFIVFLKKERLAPIDFKQYSERGLEALEVFLEKKQSEFNQKDIVEFNFRDQSVLVEGAELNGKIDRIVILENGELEVHDYKTGKPLEDWEDNTETYKKIKSYEYERQLTFYKLLVENSREFGGNPKQTGKKVTKGVLDFVEPKRENDQIITLDMIITKEKAERLKNLVSIVYKKIKNLDFPDISKYPKDLKGIEQFEEDLLEGKI
jgi:DNA helicase-2/ATP-dependent DNA helicase PcrA